MKKLFILLFLFLFIVPVSPIQAASVNPGDVHVYSYDGSQFLGTLSTNIYDPYSVFNRYGTYGSKYSTNSIWNQYGTYGSKYSSYGAANPYTSTPPILVYNGSVVGYVTANKYLSGNRVTLLNLWSLAKSL